MTPVNTLSPELQNAQDLITAALDQRNASQNRELQLVAQLTAANRKIAELEAKMKASDAEPELPLQNGHDVVETFANQVN